MFGENFVIDYQWSFFQYVTMWGFWELFLVFQAIEDSLWAKGWHPTGFPSHWLCLDLLEVHPNLVLL